jgi:hypothetical protein
LQTAEKEAVTMIRQTMEWTTFCTEEQCSACVRRSDPAWREQVMALTGAVTFLLSGMGVILLESSLLMAVVTGLVTGGCGLVLAAKLTKRRLKTCGNL